jgi:DNA-binding response OmpR family regulator/AraC-like DNA-binding protein
MEVSKRGMHDRSDHSRRVLWIDDEPESIAPLARFLSAAGYQVDVAEAGQTGLELARRRVHDIIILDWKLPDQAGTQVLEKLRQESCEMPVVVLTGYATEKLAFECGQRGAVRFESKPISGSALIAALEASTRSTEGLPFDWAWTTRTCGLVDGIADTLPPADDATSEAQHFEIMRRVGQTLVDSAIVIPEVMAGTGVFKSFVGSSTLSSRTLRGALRLLETAVFEAQHLDEGVVQAILAIEAWRPGSPLPTEESIVELMQRQISFSHLGMRIEEQTKLGWVGWKMGAKLRVALRQLVLTEHQVKEIGPDSGWSSPEQFGRQFSATLGMSPAAFRELINQGYSRHSSRF